MNTMTVLIACDTFAPDRNGTATFSKNLAVNLQKRGYEVHVIAPATSKLYGTFREQHDGVPIIVHRLKSYRLPFQPSQRFVSPVRLTNRLSGLLKAINPSVVHIQSHINIGHHAAIAAVKSKIRLVATSHIDPQSLVENAIAAPKFVKNFLTRLLLKDAARVFRSAESISAPTKRAAQMLETAVQGLRVLPISGGVDVDLFNTLPEPKQSSRKLLYVGRLDREKHVYVLLAALAKVPESSNISLEVVGSGSQSSELVKLASELGIGVENIFHVSAPLNLTSLNKIADLDFPDLKFAPFRSRTAKALSEVDSEDSDLFFAAIRQGEILLHHPYESFTSSVVNFLENAAKDPHVLAIKQTLYRTSGDSPIIEALIEAAEAGKQVVAVIEIRARFDEQANVRWARKLEAAGVHVVYGLMGLKTHAKLSLVVRDEPQGIRRYCHIGTGNYNPKTARIYEDLGILSADVELTEDLTRLFNQLSGFAPQSTYSRLLVAPRTLRSGLIERIDREIEHAKNGLPAGIQFKLNSILDEGFVAKLYEASQAGVKIELLIRGICAVQPGIKGVSENITVKSILGRFLEHSRIYHFINGGDDEYWIGSADLMGRNLDRRVESLVLVQRKEHHVRLQYLLDLGLSSDTSSWQLDGTTWTRPIKKSATNVHAALIEHYSKER